MKNTILSALLTIAFGVFVNIVFNVSPASEIVELACFGLLTYLVLERV